MEKFRCKNSSFQLDQWIINSMKHVKDCKLINYGVTSDHSTTILNLKAELNKEKEKIVGFINWNLFLNDDIKSDINTEIK